MTKRGTNRSWMQRAFSEHVGIKEAMTMIGAGTVRPPEGKSAAPDGPDGEIQGSRGSLIQMRDMDSLKGHYT